MSLPNLSGSNIQDTYQRVLHTDGTKLYNGTGSLMPLEFDGNNVIISGTLRASAYIVTESVTSVSSGSTIFGNSMDDLHQFTGSIDVSGSLKVGENGNTWDMGTTGVVSTLGRDIAATNFALGSTATATHLNAKNEIDFSIGGHSNRFMRLASTGKLGINMDVPDKTLSVGGTFGTSGNVTLGESITNSQWEI